MVASRKHISLFLLFLVFFYNPGKLLGQNLSRVILTKPYSEHQLNFSGDHQYQTTQTPAPKPLRIQVLDKNSRPVKGIVVGFELISQPPSAVGFTVHPAVTTSDSLGYITTYIHLGSKPGEYFISARAINSKSNLVVFEAHARDSKWLFILLTGLIGGLSLFIMGMVMMSDGLKKAAGDKMRAILTGITNNRFVAVFIGAAVTMVIQSSSATTVMLVGFVQSGLMTFSQSLGIILGADIGTTVTAQIIAFKLTDYALWFVAIGFGFQMFSASTKLKEIGTSILGFGILFFGIHIMSEAMAPLRTYDPFIQILLELENPLFGILIGALLTALFQSSSAFIGIIIVISTQGMISLEAAIALLLGANLGTAITAILASLKANRDAKKVALAHTIFKVIGILVFVWWIPKFAEIIQQISPQAESGLSRIEYMAQVVPRQIANAHTIFNVALTILFLPFTGKFARLIDKIIPDKIIPEDVEIEVKYLDENIISTPALALSLAKQEVCRIGDMVQDMANDILLPFFVKDASVLSSIGRQEKQINYLRDRINSYLRKITREDIREERVNEAFQIMYTVKEFEQIADLISKNLIKRAYDWVHSPHEFTEEGKKELMSHHTSTQKQIRRAITVFNDLNLEKAKEMKQKNKKYRQMAIELERQHFQRIRQDIRQSIESSEMHLELITSFKIITSHATNIARIMLEWQIKPE
ncbi:MAG: Na/Pi symporter [Bacteroidota bacterium]|nr:Na/Pi symporter [Bacteroidota bacterium]